MGICLLVFGWKHITRHVPLAAAILNNGSADESVLGEGPSSNNAGKSFVNTNVDW